MTKDDVTSDRVILPKRQIVDPKELARHHPMRQQQQQQRKLPPEPGRTPRGTCVPDDEILPRRPLEPTRE